MEWVKSLVGYYRRLDIATGTDAMEVMFKRADALAGELGTNGFIPDAMLPLLTRKPAQAKKIAEQLATQTDLWVRVPGGYVIVDWETINAELVRLHDRKKRDRDRKRTERAASRGSSTDMSVDASEDGPAPRPVDSLLLYESESKNQSKKAAAAASDTQPTTTPTELTPAVEILRAALEARKLVVRWDRLTRDQVAEIESLIDTHGDSALVKSAMHAYQPNKPAVYASAWLPGWRDLRKPGDLALVRPGARPRCHTHDWIQLTDNGACTACAAERTGGTR